MKTRSLYFHFRFPLCVSNYDVQHKTKGIFLHQNTIIRFDILINLLKLLQFFFQCFCLLNENLLNEITIFFTGFEEDGKRSNIDLHTKYDCYMRNATCRGSN